ncbi:MAG: hypothetical protein HP002_01310 [Lentisphaeria bacterium]|nr:hypothetical protein [Lentisphaeria bacterium]
MGNCTPPRRRCIYYTAGPDRCQIAAETIWTSVRLHSRSHPTQSGLAPFFFRYPGGFNTGKAAVTGG